MNPWLDDGDLKVYVGDCLQVLRELPAESVHCVVTSPPYWALRDYETDGQLGLEKTPGEYVANLVAVFREVHRVLRSDGTVWLNLGDSYHGGGNYRGTHSEETLSDKQRSNGGARGVSQLLGSRGKIEGLKNKELVGIPWRVAFALQADGWYLRSDIVWAKQNPMPESVTDRPTKSHEYVFLLSKSPRYFFDQVAVMEPAEWARWGTQTNLKHQGSESAASWIKPKTKAQLQERGRRLNQDRGDGGGGGFYRVDSEEMGWRNIRSVWSIATESYEGAHFATFPTELPRRCIKAGCPEGGVVLDPFAGAGTVGLVARELGRRSVLIELSVKYAELILRRTQQLSLLS